MIFLFKNAKIYAFKFCFSQNVQLSGLLNTGFCSIQCHSAEPLTCFTQVLEILEGFQHF